MLDKGGEKVSKFNNKNTGLVNSMDFKKTSVKLTYFIFLLLMFLLALICLLPPLWILLSSMKSVREFYQIPPSFLPEKFQWGKLISTWKKLKFLRFYINSFVLVAGSVVSAVLINGLAGYVLSRLKPWGSKVYLKIMIWTMLLPGSLSLVPLFKNMVSFPIIGINLTNTYWPMWLIAGASAYNVLLFKGFFDQIPISLIEAASIDGSSIFGTFWRIITPMSKPIISVVTIFTINGAWGDFMMPYLVLKDPTKYTVMVKIFTMKGTTGFTIDVQMMSIIFAIIPPVILFLILQKNIMYGFNLSGIKE